MRYTFLAQLSLTLFLYSAPLSCGADPDFKALLSKPRPMPQNRFGFDIMYNSTFCTAKVTPRDELAGRTEGPRDLEKFKTRPDNCDDNSGNALNFMAGSWIGTSGPTTIEETWSPLQKDEWFGIRKTKAGDKVEFNIFNFRYTGGHHGGLHGTMRKADNDLTNITPLLFLTRLDNHEKGKASIEFSDGSKSTYKIDGAVLKATIDGQAIQFEKR